ncbi:MAG TPA: dTDP-4-dehydrorhamnose 3,5-epimerase [Bacteroidales bacterium]|nr:dTDP-4-dehydrorhamnose 3,5-epimerase [Bacteroidales bacterium]HPK29931.1 dTDP-4-dehydrorhamnose 3,5-epimerase [Bacteroidales bacterium]
MNFIKTGIEGPVIIEPKVFYDHRGYFFESFSLREFEANVQKINFVQDNESLSAKRGVIRALHFQKGEAAQAKLIRVVQGRVLDVAVDIRPESPTYGKYVSVELSAENKRMFFIPRGFAHGYLVLEDNTIFQYKCDNYYAPEMEDTYRWNDPALAIDWGIDPKEVILSARDAEAPAFPSS